MLLSRNMKWFNKLESSLLLVSFVLLNIAKSFSLPAQDAATEHPVQPWETSLQYIKPRTSPEEQATAVDALAKRLLLQRAQEFSFFVDPSVGPPGKDTFIITSPGKNNSVDITGTSGVAAAWGLLHYLKYKCYIHISWEANQLALPTSLPAAKINITSNDRFRYYQNVCTVSYSMAWWKWDRWQREIDWMALNGINMPLAFTGQEAIWQRLYLKLGLTQQEIDSHFAGPAFLAWGRMGNIQGWGGPLPQSWHSQTLALQHQILQRMRQLGMTPILPAFAGHIPAGLARVYPEANITRLGPWSHFNCTYSCTYMLDPNDPLFNQIGSEFIKQLSSEFGTDHLYNCDTFNEMQPLSSDPEYLRSIGASIYRAMTTADPGAIWVMQGWLFFNAAYFWHKPQAEALLTSVPIGRMLVLDLAAEIVPQYSRLESFFGQPFIFCMLHDYGGVDGFFGNVDQLLNNMEEARNFPNVTLVGTGLTPEGINQNYVMYDLMNELAWRKQMPNISNWVESYAIRRYHSQDSRLGQAWTLLMRSVYNCKTFLRYHGKNVVIMQRPHVKPRHLIWYSIDDVIKAWDLFIAVIEDSKRMGPHNTQLRATTTTIATSTATKVDSTEATTPPPPSKTTTGDTTTTSTTTPQLSQPPSQPPSQHLSPTTAITSSNKSSININDGDTLFIKSDMERIESHSQKYNMGQYVESGVNMENLEQYVESGVNMENLEQYVESGTQNMEEDKDEYVNLHGFSTTGTEKLDSSMNSSGYHFIADSAIDYTIPKKQLHNKKIHTSSTSRAETPTNETSDEKNMTVLIKNSLLNDRLFTYKDDVFTPDRSSAIGQTMTVSLRKEQKQEDFTKQSPNENDDLLGRMSRAKLPLIQTPTFLHDVADLTRQVLQILGGEVALRMIDYFHSADKFGIELESKNLQLILKDMDHMLSTIPDFLLGSWTASASSWATNEKERELYVHNALNQVTLWGPHGEILDYAIKQWSGLIMYYVRPRWKLFAERLIYSLEAGIPYDKEDFYRQVFSQVEHPFSKNVNASYPSQPTGDTIEMALLLHGKYRPYFNDILKKLSSRNEEVQPNPSPGLHTSSTLPKMKKKVSRRKPAGHPYRKRDPGLTLNTVDDGKSTDRYYNRKRDEAPSHNSIWNIVLTDY